MTRTAVFTALAGEYEHLKPHPDVDTRWIAFTDGSPEDAKAQGWEHRSLLFDRTAHPRMRAKFYKVNATSILPGFDRTLWVDASVELVDKDWTTEQLEDNRGLTVFRHPERDDIYDEAIASMDMPKYQHEKLLAQVAHYHGAGHPRHWGLWAGGVIGRLRSPFISSLETAWWKEIERWSYQDQLSLPFVLRRHSLYPGEMAGDLYDNPFFRIHFQPQAR